jgi:hypothetical protein
MKKHGIVQKSESDRYTYNACASPSSTYNTKGVQEDVRQTYATSSTDAYMTRTRMEGWNIKVVRARKILLL